MFFLKQYELDGRILGLWWGVGGVRGGVGYGVVEVGLGGAESLDPDSSGGAIVHRESAD